MVIPNSLFLVLTKNEAQHLHIRLLRFSSRLNTVRPRAWMLFLWPRFWSFLFKSNKDELYGQLWKGNVSRSTCQGMNMWLKTGTFWHLVCFKGCYQVGKVDTYHDDGSFTGPNGELFFTCNSRLCNVSERSVLSLLGALALFGVMITLKDL